MNNAGILYVAYRLKLTNASPIFGILIEDAFVVVVDQIKCISREISFVVKCEEKKVSI